MNLEKILEKAKEGKDVHWESIPILEGKGYKLVRPRRKYSRNNLYISEEENKIFAWLRVGFDSKEFLPAHISCKDEKSLNKTIKAINRYKLSHVGLPILGMGLVSASTIAYCAFISFDETIRNLPPMDFMTLADYRSHPIINCIIGTTIGALMISYPEQSLRDSMRPRLYKNLERHCTDYNIGPSAIKKLIEN